MGASYMMFWRIERGKMHTGRNSVTACREGQRQCNVPR